MTALISPLVMRHLRRKLTLRVHGEQVVLVKRKPERIEPVWMMAFLWALYLPDESDLSVEVDVGARLTPDVVSMDPRCGRPRFWGEAGHVGPEKIESLVTRYPHTPLAGAKRVAPSTRCGTRWPPPCPTRAAPRASACCGWGLPRRGGSAPSERQSTGAFTANASTASRSIEAYWLSSCFTSSRFRSRIRRT